MSSISSFIKSFRNKTRTDSGLNGDAQRIEQLAWMLFLKIYNDKEEEWALTDDKYVSLVPEKLKWSNWADTSKEKGLKGDELLNFVNNELFPTLQKLDIPAGSSKKQTIIRDVFEDIHNYMKDGTVLWDVLDLINSFNFSDPKEIHIFGSIYESILRELQNAGSSGEFYTPRAITDFMSAHVDLKVGDNVADFACGTGGFLNSARKFLDKDGISGKDLEIISQSFFGIEKKPLPYLLCVTNLLLNGVDEPKIYHDNSLLIKNVYNYGQDESFDVILMNPPYGGSENDIVLQNFPTNMRSKETADLFIILIMNRLKKKTGRAAVIIPDGFLFGTGNKVEIKKALYRDFNVHTIVRLPTSVFAPYTSIATNIIFFNADGPTKETWFYRVDMPDGYKNFSKTKPMKLEHLDELDKWWNNRQEISEDGFFKAKKYSTEDIAANDYNLDLCGYPHDVEDILAPDVLIKHYLEERKKQEQIIDNTLAKIMALIEDK